MIKPLMLQHADQLSALHQQGFEKGWSAPDFGVHIKNPQDDVLGLDISGVLQGFILMRTQDDQAEVLTIVVGEPYARHGLGGQLLRAGELAAARRGAQIVFLEVAKDNPAAIRLYQMSGYHRCGTRDGYYRRKHGRVDALLFQKHLERV